METKSVKLLNKAMFWDINFKELDARKNKAFIINRVLQFGDIKDYNWILNNYGLTEVKKVFKQIRSLDRKSANYWSIMFNIPNKQIRCLKKPSQKIQTNSHKS